MTTKARAKQLERARRKREQTQAEAAWEMGVAISTWNRWENGKGWPKQRWLKSQLEKYMTD